MRHRVSFQRPQVGLAVRTTMGTAVVSVPLRGRVVALGVACLLLGAVGGQGVRAQSDHGQQAMMSSGVFSIGGVDLHPHDRENFPEEERAYELRVGAPARWVERLGVYGMWVHGDYPTWSMNLPARSVSTYRTYRKNHGDSPGEYPWVLVSCTRGGESVLD